MQCSNSWWLISDSRNSGKGRGYSDWTEGTGGTEAFFTFILMFTHIQFISILIQLLSNNDLKLTRHEMAGIAASIDSRTSILIFQLPMCDLTSVIAVPISGPSPGFPWKVSGRSASVIKTQPTVFFVSLKILSNIRIYYLHKGATIWRGIIIQPMLFMYLCVKLMHTSH